MYLFSFLYTFVCSSLPYGLPMPLASFQLWWCVSGRVSEPSFTKLSISQLVLHVQRWSSARWTHLDLWKTCALQELRQVALLVRKTTPITFIGTTFVISSLYIKVYIFYDAFGITFRTPLVVLDAHNCWNHNYPFHLCTCPIWLSPGRCTTFDPFPSKINRWVTALGRSTKPMRRDQMKRLALDSCLWIWNYTDGCPTLEGAINKIKTVREYVIYFRYRGAFCYPTGSRIFSGFWVSGRFQIWVFGPYRRSGSACQD